VSDQMALPGLENPQSPETKFGYYGAGATELETRAAIGEIEAELGPLTGSKRMTKQLAISLAQSVDKGNSKGRAVANEASQLFFMIQQLAPVAPEETDQGDLSPQTKALLDAFSSGPQLQPRPEGLSGPGPTPLRNAA
jgi:hypothetical protein